MILVIIHLLQFISFIGSQITNGFLIFQILTKTEKMVGNYKFLMLAFAVSSVCYGWIDVWTLPLMHVKGSIYVVFVTGYFKQSPILGRILVCIYCSSFSLVISLLSTQFLYRFWVLCKPSILCYFDGYKLIFLFLPSIISTFLWFHMAFWFACCTPEKQEILREDLLEFYDEDSLVIPFSAIMFWRMRGEEKEWMRGDMVAASSCGCIVTILPMIFVFTPSGIVLTLPLFGLYEGPLVNIVGITVAFYPTLEPIVTIACIKEFRRFEFGRREDRVIQPRNSCVVT